MLRIAATLKISLRNYLLFCSSNRFCTLTFIARKDSSWTQFCWSKLNGCWLSYLPVSTSKTYLLRIFLYEMVAHNVDSVFSGTHLCYCWSCWSKTRIGGDCWKIFIAELREERMFWRAEDWIHWLSGSGSSRWWSNRKSSVGGWFCEDIKNFHWWCRSVDVGCSGESCAIRAADRDDWISLVIPFPK